MSDPNEKQRLVTLILAMRRPPLTAQKIRMRSELEALTTKALRDELNTILAARANEIERKGDRDPRRQQRRQQK
jgi:hypothetical protein